VSAFEGKLPVKLLACDESVFEVAPILWGVRLSSPMDEVMR